MYSKQYLHSTENRYFVAGKGQAILESGEFRLAPAICYESTLEAHFLAATAMGANLYIASVAKTNADLKKAYKHYAQISRQYSIPVLMVNFMGKCDGFQCAGGTSVWGQDGNKLGSLDESSEGILLFDAGTMKVS